MEKQFPTIDKVKTGKDVYKRQLLIFQKRIAKNMVMNTTRLYFIFKIILIGFV